MKQESECDHAKVLCAIHDQFLQFGLIPCPLAEETVLPLRPTRKFYQPDQVGGSPDPEVLSFEQSATGAFSPLRYTDGERIITVHALAMFGDLILTATSTPSRTGAVEGSPGSRSDVIRRLTLDVAHWLQEGAADSQGVVRHTKHQGSFALDAVYPRYSGPCVTLGV